jgi:hypothetical protein
MIIGSPPTRSAAMNTPLHVLVLEDSAGAANSALDELEAAGHAVSRCHDSADAFPCAALAEDGQCPLDAGDVDVALDVRAHPHRQPSPLEDGVACALRHRLPLVVAGGAALDPYDDFATVVLDRPYDVVDACVHAAEGELAGHTAVATRATDAATRRDERGAEVAVSVHRRAGTLVVDITAPASFDRRLKTTIATRVTGALRAFDRHARGIDVVFNVG